MAVGERGLSRSRPAAPLSTWLPWLLLSWLLGCTGGQEVLNPPYFNLAEGRKINASSTCGEGVTEPELYCKLVGANTDQKDNPNINLIQGQVCDFCVPSDPKRAHPPENAIDGTEKWWQSPPLSRSNRFNEVNLTIYLGQEFHVAYVFIKMGNSPRPGVWVLERSTDNGTAYTPWQYFADTPFECERYFGPESLKTLEADDSVICETKFSKVVPLEGGEMVVSLLNKRPSAANFSHSTVLQEWTKATNVRLRFLRTKTLLGHLMSVARQDPTVTRRYFYSVKDINIGGRCVCNGHAETCAPDTDKSDKNDPYKLLCQCRHDTCGPQCQHCCEGYQQKKWSRAIINSPFVCEPCNCFHHSTECVFDEEVDAQHLSLDIHGHYEGGGVCKNCQHNTQGINCNQCKPKFYRPYGKLLNATDVCQHCNCDPSYSTGNCAEGSGHCECRAEFRPPNCDSCSFGYYGYPICKPCDCHPNGTIENVCEVGGGQCPCKYNFGGHNCSQCKEGYYNFPECLPCGCIVETSVNSVCQEDGQCFCQGNFGGRQCEKCRPGYYNYPKCEYCSCDPTGCVEEICDSTNGDCICRPGYSGLQCDKCSNGYFGYPNCKECNCSSPGSVSDVCDHFGRCRCFPIYSGPKCDQCSPGFYKFPECLPCECSSHGAIGVSCDDNGICTCRGNFDHDKCDVCYENFYNYPLCEECNCNPAGVLATFLGCGSLTSGELCECKERVTGRICNECKPLYWNLKTNNPLGCEDCTCFLDGTAGEISVCDRNSGQCVCKPNVGSRQCSQCKDGSYQLDRDDLFGCKDCGCDIGGSVNNICDKETGQCACRPRINGQRCDKPLQTHFFPTLFQHQYEIEDGRTPVGTQVRFAYDETAFRGFSWRGYAVFSDIQKEILLDFYVEKPSIYRVLFRYCCGENTFGTITFTPEIFGEIQQSSDMVFETTTKPRFMKVSGKQGSAASPFVLNPGRWTASIRIEKPIFLDYMVLLPQAYYEATLIQEIVSTPCGLNGHNNEMCQDFRYPTLPKEAVLVRGEAGYIADGDDRIKTNIFSEEDVLKELQSERMAWLDNTQQSLHLDFRISRAGLYVILLTYHTPDGGRSTPVSVEVSTSDTMEKGKAIFYDCSYSFHCRQVVIDQNGEVAMFNLDSNYASVKLETETDSSIAIDNVALVPADLWHVDYVVPETLCIRQGGKCIESIYFPIPESTKTEFESSLEDESSSNVLPNNNIDSSVGLVHLHQDESMVDLPGSVPSAGLYTFVVHYYQPDHPEFPAQVIIQNGQFYEATLPLSFCPSTSGCRAVIQALETNSTSFQILENYVLTIKQAVDKSVWLDYAITIPSDQFHETYLHPLPQDKAGKFITECGQNSFYLTPDNKGFCRDAAFSLTSDYNNGALPCKCDTDGSFSYECQQFGGQCQCRPNVIGRTCSQCQTGYFGFPNCKACDCPSTSMTNVCHHTTGQCICPPQVTGDKCDTCVAFTYGFHPIIGCEECYCNYLGVVQGNLQCDLFTGQCSCKPNVVGRTCDKCKPGYWAFPHCQLCNCDLRGSTEDICEQDSARCYCKENVYGDSCNQCKPGTFHLEETNSRGCTKCFCFGTTDRCSSTFGFTTQVLDMESWSGLGIKLDNDLTVVSLNATVVGGSDISAIFSTDIPSGSLFYFSAPDSYKSNKLSSYGGSLSFTILSVIDSDAFTGSFVGPDLILMGSNITVAHDHVEQPAGGHSFQFSVDLLEREFHHISGSDVTHEQMMMLLVNLESVLIRGSFFYPSHETRLSNVLMDVVVNEFVADAPQSRRVEQCQCPQGYMGNSCESCSPGHYRAKTGPYLGYCVPCQCNGHADSCDVNTGKCMDCKHNTIGDFCEKCESGYHGDSSQGTPYDCLICACPLPIETNNFADSCEVSPSGLEISCNCKPGYIGARCSACAAGYYGRPEYPGSYCQPCKCSGNIDPSRPGSCDSITGECVMCLNNTYGTACELCAPGFYGDAVSQKNCAKCNCKECGTSHCNPENGQCSCRPNVEGRGCDHCAQNFWGFKSCAGCRHCNCGPASKIEQCDFDSGQCDCEPGAAGLTCDVCEPGFWNYTKYGCLSCNCHEKYSDGVVCDAVSGRCQCLPGVIGDKCDSCPYRWVFLKHQGCLECGPCVHALLDVTDLLQQSIEPVMHEMQDISTSYFANKRLQNVNRTVDNLRIAVDALIHDSAGQDFSPLVYDVQSLEKQIDSIDKSASRSQSQAGDIAKNAEEVKRAALEFEKSIQDSVKTAREIVVELGKLSEGLLGSSWPNVDHLIAEAEHVLELMKRIDFESYDNDTQQELSDALDALDHANTFELPVISNKDKFKYQKERLFNLISMIAELKNNSNSAFSASNDAQSTYLKSRDIPLKAVLEEVSGIYIEAGSTTEAAQDLLDSAKGFSGDLQSSYEKLTKADDRLLLEVRNLKDHIDEIKESIEEIRPITEQSRDHAEYLTEQASRLDGLLADTRESSELAVQAANVYSNIIDAINDSFVAAQSAVDASEQAGTMSDGIAEKAEESKQRSMMLLNDALVIQDEVSKLTPKLEAAKDGVKFLAQQNGKTSQGLDIISKYLKKLPLHTLSVLSGHAANSSALADANAKKALTRIQNMADELPDQKLKSEEIPQSIEDSKQAIKAAHSYIDRVSSIIPDTSNLMKRTGSKVSSLKLIGTDVADKIAKLQKKVALARNKANRIKLGVQFFENTTLQVRNPEGMQKAATYTHMSLYFKTLDRYGLLAYVGNEKGSHVQMKRVRTDDCLALEIRGGRVVLTMDLGSGPQDIKHNAYVSDGKWHQVVLERTGKTATLTVRTEDEEDVISEGFLPGIYSVFNLDQQISKFYVGGIRDRSKIQETVQNFHFDGCIEDVEFGKTPIGLWDFEHAENNFESCLERDQLALLVPSNGLRFSGNGYAILQKKKLNFASETYIKMKFKTYAPEGLLFLVGEKNGDFFALELREGHVVMKYELGSGVAAIISKELYNDGEWHSLEATRENSEAILKVDNIEVGSGTSPGGEVTLSTTNDIYVGGSHGHHNYSVVTNIGFDGCIMDMQISADLIDLNKNIEALGVVNGCPVTIARVVSFSNESSGYVAMPPANLEQLEQLTFKFKTLEEDGLLFYAANEDQSDFLSISLQGGIIVMHSSPGDEIKTSPDVKYNDKEWHYVSASKTARQMRLDIDDIDSVEVLLTSSNRVKTTTPLYFGGVPSSYSIRSETIPNYKPFVGCLGDTTVNNRFQNFAETQDRESASLATCPLVDPHEITTPSPIYTTEESTVTTPEPITPESAKDGKCVLPLIPKAEKTKPRDGTQFGDVPNSRQEFVKSDSFMQTIVDESTFALEFQTSMQNGVMFYVSGTKHRDFIGLYMSEGKIIYAFNCGSGIAIISSQSTYNDGKWHRVVFSRQGVEGTLLVGDQEEVKGASLGSASSVNVRAPFYVGGLSEDVARLAKNNLRDITTSFPGCIRYINAQNEPLTFKKTTTSFNITGCSDNVEKGTFFSANGGHIILYDKYRVGQNKQFSIDIKPRSHSGIILAVHGNRDYLILQMVDGRVSFQVDNGHKPITTTFFPSGDYDLCNGEWHKISVAKINNVVTLSVDGMSAAPGIGASSVSSTDTDDPLYIGGIPDPSTAKGVETDKQFAGCMRYLIIDGKPQDLAQSRISGNVRLNTCSTI